MNNFEILEFKNITTETKLIPDQTPIEMVECDEGSIVFLVDKMVCSKGHLISLKGNLIAGGLKRSDEVFIIGKVIDIVACGENSQKIHIKLVQYDKKLWAIFIDVLLKNQTRVDKLFKSMKDDE